MWRIDHVTDPIKYRGPKNNAMRMEGMQPWMREKSARYLRMEYNALKPCCVLMTKLASSWFKGMFYTSGTPGLPYESSNRRAWHLDPKKRKLDDFLSNLQEEGVPEEKWEEALGAMLTKLTLPCLQRHWRRDVAGRQRWWIRRGPAGVSRFSPERGAAKGGAITVL